MQNKLNIQFSPSRLKQMKKIALSGSRAKLKILNGKTKEGFQILKTTAKKFKSFATDLADRIPKALAARISLDLFSHFEQQSSKRLGIPKGIVLGGVLALMASLPAAGQIINVANTNDTGVGSLRQAIIDANANGAAGIIRLANGTTYTISSNLPSIVDQATGGTLQIICTGTSNAIIDGQRVPNTSGFRPITMDPNSDLTLTNITLQNGFSAAQGGAIYNNRGDLRISNAIITNSEANAGGGGGIYSTGNGGTASVFIQNSTISMNTASTQGGGIYNRLNSSLTISSSSISGNTSNGNGGGIFNQSFSPLTISSSSIFGNTSNDYGGGIYNNNNSPLIITSSSISGNTSTNDGGGIYNRTNSPLTISRTSISGNKNNNGQGGGIYNGTNSPLTISSSSIAANTSNFQGGGVFNHDNSSLTIFSSSISNNVAGNRGGGIYNNNNSPVIISHSSISGNTNGVFSGGGIYNSSSSLLISNSLISNNINNGRGGGIYNTSNSLLTISSSSISGNQSGVAGGIHNSSNSTLMISSSSLTGNNCFNRGGGLYNLNSNMTIQASSITANQSTSLAGGAIMIFANGGYTSLLKNTTISGNSAPGSSGGGIYHRTIGGTNDITLQHVTISDNTGNAGAGFHITNDPTNINIANSIIANSSGGAIDFARGATTSIIVTASIIESSTLPVTSATAVDPLLGALTLNSGFLIHPVKTTSSAINFGTNLAFATDQLGNPRGATPTIGAVEVTIPGVCMVVSAPAGVTNTWIGCTNSDWNTATNWSSGTVPTASDVVYVPIVAANQLIIDEVATCAKMVVQIGAKCLVDYNAGGKLLIKF